MAAGKGDEAKPFLSRWSERKRQAGEAARDEAQEPEAGRRDAPESGQDAEVEAATIDPATLPDIDSLAADSDFTVFMRTGVPEALKQRALRRLWQVDPAFNVICPLDDYNLDYTDAATVVPNLKTLYQVGRGMVLPEAGPAPAPEPQSVTAAGSPDVAAALSPAPSVEASAEPAGPSALPSPGPDGLAEQPAERIESDAANREAAAVDAGVRPSAGSARRRRWGDFDI